MPSHAIDTDRLYRKIARMISELIASGEFVPGSGCPASAISRGNSASRDPRCGRG